MRRALSFESVEGAIAAQRRDVEERDPPPVTMRFASRADAQELRRLAELDSGTVPTGTALVAELDARLVAALPVGGGRPLADPFRPTADLVRLLQLRAAQLRGHRRRPRRAQRAPARHQSVTDGGR